jgi:spore germination protein GerM
VRRRLAFLALLSLLVVAAAGCGAPIDSGPRALRAAQVPADLRQETSTTTATTIPSGVSSPVTIFFVTGDRLAPVTRQVRAPATVEKVLQQLFTGPTGQERNQGLRTNVSAGATILGSELEGPVGGKIATIDLADNFAFGSLPEQIIAFGQVVFTATSLEGVTGVRFTQNGRRQEVPQGDGSFASVPVGRASYPLLTPR